MRPVSPNMKTSIKDLFLLSVLIAGLGLMLAGRVTAQTFTTLHSFTAILAYPVDERNSDGANPYADLTLSGHTLYGTAANGGSSGDGTLFGVNTDGTGFTNLHSFTGSSDGAHSNGLILSGNTLYGTANSGGSWDNGTVFAVNTDGTGFTTLYNFTAGSGSANSDGARPQAKLVLSGNTLYGTTQSGGSWDNGTVFAVKTDGTGFTNLHSLTGGSEGATPSAGLVLTNNTLYGTAQFGGGSGSGTMFALKTDGTGFRVLHTFAASASPNYINSNGAQPTGDLTLSGDSLFGAASVGGSAGNGTVFKVGTDGTAFKTLYTFGLTTSTNSLGSYTNSDGVEPYAGLILSGNSLYGTALVGGSGGGGTVFMLSADGTGFSVLHTFTSDYSNYDGAQSWAGLILSGNSLYGAAYYGGSSGNGTVFSISFTPQLTISPSRTNPILTWPTNYATIPDTFCNLPRTLVHRRFGPPILPALSSSTSRTQ